MFLFAKIALIAHFLKIKTTIFNFIFIFADKPENHDTRNKGKELSIFQR